MFQKRTTLFHTESGMKKWAGKGRTLRCLEAAGQPGRSSRQQRELAVGTYQLLFSAACPEGSRWGSPRQGTVALGSTSLLSLWGLKGPPPCLWWETQQQGRKCLQTICVLKVWLESLPHFHKKSALWVFWYFSWRKRVVSYVIFNSTSACAWINGVQTNRSISSWEGSLKKCVCARFLAACNLALLFKWHSAHLQAGQSLGHNCQTNSG